MPAKTQTKSSKKIEKLKQSNKLNKNRLIAKTLKAFTPKSKVDPFKYTYFKNMFKANFCSEIGPLLNLQDLKKIHWPLKIEKLENLRI